MRGGERLVKKCSSMRGICSRLYHSTEKSKTFSCRCPSSVMVNNRFRSADYLPCQLFNFGMIATGNHNFERFAALCNTLPGEARALRASGSPSWRPLQTQKFLAISIQRTTQFRSLREAKSLPYNGCGNRCNAAFQWLLPRTFDKNFSTAIDLLPCIWCIIPL